MTEPAAHKNSGILSRLAVVLILSSMTVHTDGHAQQIDVVETSFHVTMPDGRVLSQAELVGAILTGSDAAGNPVEIRIDDVEPDTTDSAGDILLYTLSIRDLQTNRWRNVCHPGPDGRARGFPVEGLASENGGPFGLTCTSGANGKCIRMGYKPWKVNDDGTSLKDHHQACVRMLRADYCGNGVSHTRNGTVVNVFDKIGIQEPAPEPSAFEAAWGPQGAVCVRRTRVPGLLTLDELVKMCPDRLWGRAGEVCSEEAALDDIGAFILNRS